MRPIRLAAGTALLACSVGCDVGDASLPLGPRPKLLSWSPRDSEGLDCDWQSADCGVPVNRPVVFQFDRWLDPATASRQAIRVAINLSEGANFTEPVYELLSRQVTYRPLSMVSGLVHVLEINDSDTSAFGWGFSSYDALALSRENLPDAIVFRTAPAKSEYNTVPKPAVACGDALQAFQRAGCTAAHCHQTGQKESPMAGLALDDSGGLRSAIGRVARATDRAADSGRVSIQPERFGLNLPIVLARDPSRSFLLYRMLMSPDAYRNAEGKLEVAPPSPAELDRSMTWFGAMGPMPPASIGYPASESPVDLVRVIESWIRDGADLQRCSAPSDTGTH